MNINELPEEILVRILSFLPRSDRLESALTCRRWAQTVARAPPLLRDIWLMIGEHQEKEAETVFGNSHRHYENLRLKRKHPLIYNAAFWMKVGPILRKLELIGFHCSPEVFFSILQSCSNLESLKIDITCENRNCFELSELPPAIILERIQKSMFNLRHLLLDCYMDADTLERLFILMPNVLSIGISSEWEIDSLRRLPNILGASRRITMLYLDLDHSNDVCEQLLRTSSASLRSLTFFASATARRVADALRDCSMLRDLEIDTADGIRHVCNILRNFPELECLAIGNDWYNEEASRLEDLMAIFDLRRLRELHFYCKLWWDECVPDRFVQHLSRMISLERLFLGYGIVDNTCFRSLACLPNLRELVIGELRWDAACLRIVLSDLGKLKTLEIQGSSSEDYYSDYRRSARYQHAKLERNMSTPQDSVSSDRQGKQRFSSLEVLIMNGAILLCDDCLDRISSHHNRLKIVKIRDYHKITNAGLVTLFEREPLLEKLVVSSSSVNETLLEDLGELCPRLRSLKVFTRGKISTQAQERFKMRRPRVKCKFC